MELMIKKLMKELSHEKKSNKRLNYEIKRLNFELIDTEKRMKQKNDQIDQF